MSTIEKKIVSTGKYVSAEHLDGLISNYKRERWIQNSERIGQEDNLGVWCSLDALEAFIQKARENQADGINIYFGVYGGKAQRPEMEGKQTIAFVASRTEKEYGDTLVHTSGGNSPYTPGDDPMDDLMIFNYIPPMNRMPSNSKGLGLTVVTDSENNMRVI